MSSISRTPASGNKKSSDAEEMKEKGPFRERTKLNTFDLTAESWNRVEQKTRGHLFTGPRIELISS